jgi:hypothetical protein
VVGQSWVYSGAGPSTRLSRPRGPDSTSTFSSDGRASERPLVRVVMVVCGGRGSRGWCSRARAEPGRVWRASAGSPCGVVGAGRRRALAVRPL